MKLHKYFLKENLYEASKEFNCFKDCLELSMFHVDNGNLEVAADRIVDVNNSLKELIKLAQRKEEVSRQEMLVRHMQQQGIDIQLIRRRFLNDQTAK